MLKFSTYLFIFTLSVVFSTNGNSQTRPYDNTEIMTISSKTLQSDSYYSSMNNDQSRFNTLLRYGLSKNFELQFAWKADKYKLPNKNVVDETTSIGVKIHLTKDAKFLPALSLIASTNLTFDPKQRLFLPTLNLLYDKSLTNSFSINGNYQVSIDERKGDFLTNYAVNLEAKVTKWQNTYVGLTGRTSWISEVDYQHYLEIGMIFWVYDGITLYPFYDIGLTDGTGDIFNIGALFSLNK